MEQDTEYVGGFARRSFLKNATASGAAILGTVVGQSAHAQNGTNSQPAQKTSTGEQPPARSAGLPNMAAETLPPDDDPNQQSTSGGDFMVDVLKTLNIDYIAMNCASSFRGLHEALINHGMNAKPEILTCPHEEIAVAMAHGYAKIEGKPMAAICHGTVGLQHASMAIYNAWCDRVPVYVLIGNILQGEKRGPVIEWAHSAVDPGALVRDFIKWDDQPTSLQHFAESAVRAYKVATVAPMAPVLLSLDQELQENPIPNREKLHIPKLAPIVPPVADPGALAEAAKLLVNAQNPVIVVDRMARTPNGMPRLVELAETLQCPVIDLGGRMNFPTRHPLNHTFRRAPVIAQADVVLAIDMNDLWGVVNTYNDRIERSYHPATKPGTKILTLGSRDMLIKSNYQDFQRFTEVDMAIAGDGEDSIPLLSEKIKQLLDVNRRAALQIRGKALAEAHLATRERAKLEATIGWDSTPITTARLCAELYAQIKDEDWSVVGTGININWPRRLWDMKNHYSWNGGSGGAGVGYNAPASAGAALANKRHGRISVTIQGDGDLMFVPSTLWTCAHHKLPILYVVINNRSYHQEVMYLKAMAARHGRGIENAHIGTTMTNPNVDFSTVAKGFGVYAEGPIADPKDLAAAIKRAVAVVKRGEPALLDVLTDPR